ncbi:MAG: septum formation initiator family protein [Candidatus Falkowbacteria bacterium]|nr:septum formation initiator family protein [Candidatus Falkowbacteria bacterium]
MYNRKKEQKKKFNFLFSPITISLIGLIIIVLISIPLAKNISQKYKVDNDILNLQKEISKVESQNLGLDKMVNYLETDQFAEKQARLNFGLKKNGENVAVIQFNDSKAATSTETNNKTKRQYSNPQKWMRYIFAEKGI